MEEPTKPISLRHTFAQTPAKGRIVGFVGW